MILTLSLDLPLNLVSLDTNTTQYYVGNNVGLRCQARARPKPSFNWFQNGKRITVGGRIKMFPAASDSNDTTFMILAISNLQPSDAGTYECEVVDSTNSVTMNTSVNIRKYLLKSSIRNI